MDDIKILLVEDNPGDVRLLERAITRAEAGDIRLQSVPTLAEALAFLKDYAVDLVLTDLNLPDSEGYHTFRALKEAIPDCPIVIFSGVFDEDMAMQAIKEGAQDFLAKGEYSQTGIVRAIRYAIERKQAETVREDALTKAKQATLAKSQFLAIMSHELRTPMTGVIGMADLILDTDLSPKQLDWATSIKTSGENLLRILNEVLDQSKLEAGKLEIAPQDFHLQSFIDEATQLFMPAMDEKGINLTVEIAGDLPAGLHADRFRIGQVLSNLLSNAIKFTHEGTINVQVARQSETDGGLVLRFEVTDSGVGIDEDEKARLFHAFTQADTSTSRNYGGTGLGLSISKELVELMGGAIGVESEAGAGSTFWFTIRCREAGSAVEEADKRKSLDRWVADRSLRILVAEDNFVNQKLIQAIMVNLSHQVVIAENGERAVEAAQNGEFDLILMDVRMPVMDGLEATKRIRELGGPVARIPVLALTADIAAVDFKLYDDVGINDVSGKPIDLPELLKKINKLMGEAIHRSIPNAPSHKQADATGEQQVNPPSKVFGANSEFPQILQRVSDIVDQQHDIKPDAISPTPQLNGVSPDLMAEFTARFTEDAALKCGEIVKSLQALADNPDNKDARQCARAAAHVLKGQGATFGYHLVSTIATDIEDMVKNQDRLDAGDLASLNNHVSAISLVINKGITAHGGKVGRILLQGLKDCA